MFTLCLNNENQIWSILVTRVGHYRIMSSSLAIGVILGLVQLVGSNLIKTKYKGFFVFSKKVCNRFNWKVKNVQKCKDECNVIAETLYFG